MTLSRDVVKVNEIVPAVPPRRASLGILKRTSSNLSKSAGKCTLSSLKESINNTSSGLNQSESLKNEENSGLSNKLSRSEENLDERTYMVLEPESDHEYALPMKSKFFVSAEKEDEGTAPVRMTMRERLKQLTQSSEDEIDHTSDSDMSPAVDKRKSELMNEMGGSLNNESKDNNSNVGQQQVVTVKFSTDKGLLCAEGAQVVTTGKPVAENVKNDSNDSTNESKSKQVGKEPRFKIQPGTDAQGYTQLLDVNERGRDEKGSTFISYLPLEPVSDRHNSDSGVSSTSTQPTRESWVSM